ncbi:erythromycin esterase family protein [Lysobacter korlensis]|uniref:Erythromycin esterase family protein n=1 Tax=Lysobacter korlensis TaxID=553636 RepID=A0ABV6RKE4_9GAMM
MFPFGDRKASSSKHVPAALKAALQSSALPLDVHGQDFDPLLERIGDAPLVLIGEASHGTHEFYELRAQITRRLIEEKGFTAVAVEADWPDAYRVNRYVRGESPDADGRAALGDFQRFPTWMWRNTEVLGFVEWLKQHNRGRVDGDKVGFYGLDLYSLHSSVDAVLDYLQETDPDAAQRARHRYSCFDHYGEDPQAYGYAASFGLGESCEDEVIAQLTELSRRAAKAGDSDDELFFAEQNARLVANAEAYYRSMFRGRDESWNLRDTHMMETLQALMQRGSGDRPAKVVVWAHNSHLGDARATEMGRRGELNLGQLARQHYDTQAVLVGFSTYTGTVTAADDWGDPARLKRVRPGLDGSYEALFHEIGRPAFQLRLDDPSLEELQTPRLQRAIGVIYRPQTERLSHYFHTALPSQFDWMIHVDTTRALEPLEPGHQWTPGNEPPETFPSGL